MNEILTGYLFGGRYKNIQRIAVGGMSQVYKVLDIKRNRIVALKMISPRMENATQGELLARLKREAIAISRLDHPNIIAFYDIGEFQEYAFITMEFIKGQTLCQYIEANNPSVEWKVNIICKIADALDYAHGQGVVHRDVKPSNIMIDNNGHPIIMDFGIAKVRGSETKITDSNFLIGTLAYMSPEQVDSKFGVVNSRSDLYSLGIVLFQILANTLPFRGSSSEILWKICFELPPKIRSFEPDISEDLENVCLKAIAKDKKDRYKNLEEFQKDLLRYLKGIPVLAKSTKDATWKKSYTLLASHGRDFAIAVAITVCVWVGIIFLGKSSQENPSNSKITFSEVKKICWNGDIFDFTHPDWEKLTHYQQFEFAKDYQEWYGKSKNLPLEKQVHLRETKVKLMLIPPGIFWMGSLEPDGHSNQQRTRETIERPFYICKYEVTRELWYAVSKKKIQEFSFLGDNYAATHISWYDIHLQFLRNIDEGRFQLPTEQQWEYACRSGTLSRYYWGDGEEKTEFYAWHRENAYHKDKKYPQEVGKKMPNAWGVHDMSGNVYEWCKNLYAPSGASDKKTDKYVIRGGYWAEHAEDCQSSARHSRIPEDRDEDVGFRFIELINN